MSEDKYKLISQFLAKTFPKDKELWLNYVKYLSSKGNVIFISVPNLIYKERFEEKYLSSIKTFTEKSFDENISIKIFIENDDEEYSDTKKQDTENEKKELSNYNGEKQNKKDNKPKEDPKASLKYLDPKYTFEQFVVGGNSQLAYAAARRIAEYPSEDYNPLFVYGGVGLGKTHLMQAIGHSIYEKDPLMQIYYTTSEQFTNEYINSLQRGTVHSFRLKYRYADILLVDDIQFLEQKEGIQEELFHTFNMLKQSNKQMIFTSDRSPRVLKKVTDRLISRFASGLVADIKPPNFETRKAIIRKKMIKYNINLKEDIIDFLANNITNNVRDLEASVIKTKALSKLLYKNITISAVEENLQDILQDNSFGKNISVELIQRQVADYYNINYYDMKSKKRTNVIAKPRQIAIYIAKQFTNLSTTELGNEFGGRNHSTIISAYKKIEKELTRNESTRNDIDNIKTKLTRV